MVNEREAKIVRQARDAFNAELACVDEEYLKRAFEIVWLARGAIDAQALKDTVVGSGPIDDLDSYSWPC